MTDRRDFLKAIGLGAAGVGLSPGIARAAPGRAKPNVVLILVDDMGFSDLGCYGGEIETPVLDGLASKGVRFTQFYNTAKCTPTRAALMSGSYHREVGQGRLENCMTTAEVMRRAGYATMMTGKWHMSSSPVQRGFERYFGHLSGCCNYFKGDKTFRLDDEPFEVPAEGFYTTNAFTDYAMQFLDEAVGKPAASGKRKPFFLYLAYNAPHYPLHALPEDIERYRGRYMKGWDRLREERHARQLEMGLLDPRWKLAPRDAEVPAWEALSEDKKREEDLTMAVYAAMVDRVDRNIGRLLAKLRALGVAENTLLLFLSDNGGCPFQRTKTRDIPPGPADSYWTYHKGWAQVSNTPFRLYKQNQHEGGISTPLIAHWPGVTRPGLVTDQPGHLVDIMTTLLDVTGTRRPDTLDGRKLRPLRGKSLVPILQGKQREPHEEMFFEFGRYKALRAGRWKISWHKGPWELYDVEADRTELNDLAEKMPDKVAELAARYEWWLKELGGRQQKKQKKKRRPRRN